MGDRVFLIGMACSGKTTVGKALAEKLHWDLFDTDKYIKDHYNIDFRDLIKKDISKFHALEMEALIASGTRGNCVVSTGGRTYLNKANKDYINNFGKTIFIKVSVWNIIKRFNQKERSSRALPLVRLPIWLAVPLVYWYRHDKYAVDSRMVDGNQEPKIVADDILFLVNK